MGSRSPARLGPKATQPHADGSWARGGLLAAESRAPLRGEAAADRRLLHTREWPLPSASRAPPEDTELGRCGGTTGSPTPHTPLSLIDIADGTPDPQPGGPLGQQSVWLRLACGPSPGSPPRSAPSQAPYLEHPGSRSSPPASSSLAPCQAGEPSLLSPAPGRGTLEAQTDAPALMPAQLSLAVPLGQSFPVHVCKTGGLGWGWVL